MAYSPQTWADGPSGGTPLSAARLNYMEAGIAAALAAADAGSIYAPITLTLANAIPGTTFDVIYDGANWKYAGSTVVARPTSRTDLIMECINAHDTSVPSWAIAGDRLLVVA